MKYKVIIVINVFILLLSSVFILLDKQQRAKIRYVNMVEENVNIIYLTHESNEEENNNYQEHILNGAVPELEDGMIAVYYDNGWRKADLTEKWYSYEELKWANVIVPKKEKLPELKNMEPHQIINEDDVQAYYVWIPRFEYKLFNVNYELVNEQIIDINFVNKDVLKKEVVENGLYYTHPAFTAKYLDGSTYELNGFWIAKFEPSLQDNIVIKPNQHPLVSLNMADMWNYATNVSNDYGIALQSRIITNIEWGAIAYFSYSPYGKQNNPNYEGTNKNIFVNAAMGNPNTWDNLVTGCSSGRINGLGMSNCAYQYNEEYYGTGASSTGTIYGIYDLAGGAWECVMGIISNYPVADYRGGFNGSIPSETRYYTLYTESNNMFDYSRGLIGDATRETRSNKILDKSWNGNLAYFATSSFPWIKRGGTFRGGVYSGLFDYGITDALPRGDKTFRIILSKY